MIEEQSCRFVFAVEQDSLTRRTAASHGRNKRGSRVLATGERGG
jgi:hypothetical protein